MKTTPAAPQVAPTEPFDQSLFDAVIGTAGIPLTHKTGMWTSVDHYQEGLIDGARLAARIVAERAAPAPVTDEQLRNLIDCHLDHVGPFGGLGIDDEGLVAVRAALQPAPVIPDWVEEISIQRMAPDRWGAVFMDVADGEWFDARVDGYGATWQEALAAASGEAKS